jgi:hypothetical protein
MRFPLDSLNQLWNIFWVSDTSAFETRAPEGTGESSTCYSQIAVFDVSIFGGFENRSAQIRSVSIVAESSVVVALQLFGNKFIFELANLLSGKNRILRAWDYTPF